MRCLRLFALCVVASALLSVTPAVAQNAASATRIVNPIDESNLVTLKGSVHPLANAKNDRGVAADSMPLNRIHLMLKRSAGQEAALQQLMGQMHTPGNPSFHKWLTPDQFGKQFGPSDQDIATVTTWLTGHGFNVSKIEPGKQVIEFSGNVGQFRSAFHSQIHKYEVNGESHFANANNPQIPAAIAPVVGGFVSLNNFHAKSEIKSMGKASYDRTTDTATADWTWGTATGGVNFVLAPQDFAVEYDLPAASTGTTGTGQTIAIINDSNVNIDLVNQFRSLFSLPVNPPQIIVDGNDPGVNGDSVEAYLDVEWAGAVAPNATVDLVIGADTETESGLYLAAEHAVYGNIAPVMSMSFGFCEFYVGSNNLFWNNLWEQAAAQGITAMVSSGDAGSAGCDNDNSQDYAVNGQNVNGFGSTPYNVSVGGTDFYYSFYSTANPPLSDFAPYWTTTQPQATPAASLKSYLTEQPWNNSQFGLNIVSIYSESGDTSTSIAAGSGGPSNAALCSGNDYSGNGECLSTLSGYPKPSWQVGTGVPSDGVRDTPDVSLYAANGLNYSFIPICAADGDCQPATGGNVIQISGVGGTSASSPSFAGIMALVNQKYGPQGQANYVLYPLAKQYPAVFHDVTHGTNSVPCASGSTNCITVASPLDYDITDPNYGAAVEGQIGSGTTPWYNAGTGYDLSTGLGTIDTNQMLTNWPNVKFDTTTTTLTPSLTTFAHGTSITVSGGVTGTGTPTGSVALMTNSTEAGQQGQGIDGVFNTTPTTFPLSGGSFSGTTSTLPGGTYNIWGSYGGDGTNGLSTSTPVQVTVTPESSYVSFSALSGGSPISSGATGIPYGTSITLDAQAGPASCATSCPSSFTVPTGTVLFSDGSTSLNTAVVNAEGDAEYTLPTAFNVGSHSVTAKYSGDASYNGSSASAITFSVVQQTPQVLVTGSTGLNNGVPNANPQGATQTLTIAVEGLGSGLAPLGTVNISGAPSGTPTSAPLSAGVDPVLGTTVGLATVTIPASAPAGNYNITATYVPNTASATNYLGATSAAYPVVIQTFTGVVTTTAGTATATSTSPNLAVTVNGTVTAASGGPPTGSVYFFFAIVDNGTFEDVYFTSEVATLVPGSGNTSSFSMTFDSQSLVQGVNQLTMFYPGTSKDFPSTAVVTINNPLSDFALTANTTIIPVTAGSNGTTTINLAAVNGFSGAVGLTCSSAAGVTCSLSSSSVNLTAANASGASTLTVSAPSTTSAGNYNVLITGKDPTGEYVHTLGLRAQVAAGGPGFALTNSGAISFQAGATTGDTATVTVTPSGGFTGNVSLACTVTPVAATSPATCSAVTPVDITGTTAGTSKVTVSTTATTTPGTYTATVTGTSGSITGSTGVGVTVTAPPVPGIALTNNGPISFVVGATTGDTATITVTPAGGFTGNVNLTCAVTTTPASPTSPATCSVTPSVDITGTSAVTGTLTVTTTATTTTGAYAVTVTGKDGTVSGSTVVNLTVQGVPSFTLSNNGPITFGVGATSGNTATITVASVNSFASTVGLACAVTTSPTSATSPAMCSLASSTVAGGSGTDVLTIGTTSTTTTGNYAVTVTGTSGAITQTTVVNVTVNGTYTVAATSPAAIAPGASATSTVTIASTNGYAGSVTITCALTSSPAGASDLPSCSNGSQAVTLSSTATSGTATVTVGTTAATTSELVKPKMGPGKGWLGAGGGAVLALMLFFGIPARRRSWRTMLGALVLMVIMGAMAGCGGGGGGGGNKGTTTGIYTFTITATGSPAQGSGDTTTFTVTVN